MKVHLAGDHRAIWCEGCKRRHVLDQRWTFNGDVDKPTFTPSLLCTGDWGPERIKQVCHTFITDGKIQYLGDCTHELAGKTIDLPDFKWSED